jgi:hypothetical protein
MWNTRQALFFAPLLLSVTMGATDCEYYSDVVVPSSDSTPPTAYDGVWRGGEYQVIRPSGSTGLIFHIKPGQPVIAVSSGIDPQGLRKITMSSDVGWLCCDGDICSSTSSLSVPIVETQAGTVGSTVSSGIWTGQEVDLPGCNPGYTLESFRYTWTTKAENFHGGKVTSATHQIVYP